MSLCDVCQRFDIRTLIILAAERLQSPDSFDDRRNVPENLPYYSHYDSIHDVGVIARRFRCGLCALIWQDWTEKSGQKSDDFHDPHFDPSMSLGELSFFREENGWPDQGVRLYVLRLKEYLNSSSSEARLYAWVEGDFPDESVEFHMSISSKGETAYFVSECFQIT